jgi:hypothetical protein
VHRNGALIKNIFAVNEDELQVDTENAKNDKFA